MNLGGAVRFNRSGLIFIVVVGFIILLYAFGGRGQNGKGNGDDSFISNSGFLNSDKLPFPFGRNHAKVSLKALLVAAIDVAQRGGIEVVAVRKGNVDLEEQIKGKTKEGVKDSATQGDYRSHRVMYYGIRKAFPGVKVISEEHDANAPGMSDVPLPKMEDEEISNSMNGDETVKADDVSIWIDPLDATKEYTENLLEYVTTMVGVAIKGKPVIGVIHRPFLGETYWGVVGYGHSPNLNKAAEVLDLLNKVQDTSTKPLRLIVSRSHAGNVQNFTKTVLGSGSNFKVISAAGAGYKVLEVVEDRADVYIHVTAIKKWDLCAGYALINAMGGTMSTLGGEIIDFSGDTEPLNTKGILAYMGSTKEIEKLKLIKINDS